MMFSSIASRAHASWQRVIEASSCLKGAGSVAVHVNGRCAINPTGGPALATAGTGDVLAGLLGGLFAQHFDPWQATLAATWLHGRAGEGRDVGLAAGDIAKRARTNSAGLRATPHSAVNLGCAAHTDTSARTGDHSACMQFDLPAAPPRDIRIVRHQ